MDSQLPTANYQIASTNKRFLNFFIDIILYQLAMLLLINPLMRLLFGGSVYANYWSNYLFAFFMIFVYYFSLRFFFREPQENLLLARE